jgi:hypothetical protein
MGGWVSVRFVSVCVCERESKQKSPRHIRGSIHRTQAYTHVGPLAPHVHVLVGLDHRPVTVAGLLLLLRRRRRRVRLSFWLCGNGWLVCGVGVAVEWSYGNVWFVWLVAFPSAARCGGWLCQCRPCGSVWGGLLDLIA